MRQAPRKPNDAESKIEPAKNDNLIVQMREYELITPLFGGGVEPGQCDDLTPIRGTEIRGHLRFWWRATRGGKPEFEGDLKKMKSAEDGLWGAASTERQPHPSQVKIAITVTRAGTDDHPYEVVDKVNKQGRAIPTPQPRLGSQTPPYVAFPLQPEREGAITGMETRAVRAGVKFKLDISFPNTAKARADIEAALWAWETFGGIGARTRRGFGALFLKSLSENGERAALAPTPTVGEARQFVIGGLNQHVVEGLWNSQLPHLSRNPLFFKITTPVATPQLAWGKLIEKLRAFRQARGNGGRGRSKWPEPDEIRYLIDQSDPRHATPNSTVRKFPRGAFGLPIVFHFKDNDLRNKHDQNCDPADTILKFSDYERWASPLILRPLQCQGGQAVGLGMILLSGRPTGGFVLQSQSAGSLLAAPEEVFIDLNQTEADSIEPLRNAATGVVRTAILSSFLKTL